MDANDIKNQSRRLAILQLLAQDPDYSINDALMQKLLSGQGFGSGLAVIRADFAWLEQVGLISTNELPNCTVAILRAEGLDAADGVLIVPGVAKPRPK